MEGGTDLNQTLVQVWFNELELKNEEGLLSYKLEPSIVGA